MVLGTGSLTRRALHMASGYGECPGGCEFSLMSGVRGGTLRVCRCLCRTGQASLGCCHERQSRLRAGTVARYSRLLFCVRLSVGLGVVGAEDVRC